MVATAAAFMAVFVIMLMMVVMVVVMVMAAAAAFVVVVMMIMVVMFMVVVVTAAATAFAVFMIMMMVMMITVWLVSCVQSACQQSGYCSICITGNSCINFDICVIQSNSCTHAHAAADQCGDTGLCQVACQRAVAKTIVSDYFAGNNCAVLYGINLNDMAKKIGHGCLYLEREEKIKEDFDANGIEIPYNQLEVHVREMKEDCLSPKN